MREAEPSRDFDRITKRDSPRLPNEMKNDSILASTKFSLTQLFRELFFFLPY